MKQDSTNLTEITIQGTFWAYASTYGGKIMVLVTTTILARLLIKEDFGLAGYALLVIGYLDIINGIGIGPALIYFPFDSERSDSAFWLGLGMGAFLFILAWFIAPYAGIFFRDNRAIAVTRVLALTFPISSFCIVHEAILRKNLAFKVKAIPDFVRTMSKGIASIVLAISGFGVWSLIFGQLTGVLLSVIAYWGIVSWRPTFHVATKFLRSILSYGLSIVSVRALSVVLLNTDYLLVGRFLGAAALGVYTLAFRVPNLLIGQFADIMGQVLFPVYSNAGSDQELFKRGLFTTLRYVSMITIPLGFGMALVSKPFVLTFFTDKWSEAIPIVSVIAIATVLDSLSYNFGDIYKAQGRPDVLTKLSILRVLILLPALWWAVTGPGTLLIVSWTVAVVALIGTITQFFVAEYIVGISILRMLDAIRPALLGSAVMLVFVLGILNLSADSIPLIQLIVSVCTGGLTYLGMLWLFQREVVVTAFQVLRKSLVRSEN